MQGSRVPATPEALPASGTTQAPHALSLLKLTIVRTNDVQPLATKDLPNFQMAQVEGSYQLVDSALRNRPVTPVGTVPIMPATSEVAARYAVLKFPSPDAR